MRLYNTHQHTILLYIIRSRKANGCVVSSWKGWTYGQHTSTEGEGYAMSIAAASTEGVGSCMRRSGGGNRSSARGHGHRREHGHGDASSGGGGGVSGGGGDGLLVGAGGEEEGGLSSTLASAQAKVAAPAPVEPRAHFISNIGLSGNGISDRGAIKVRVRLYAFFCLIS